MQFLAGIHTSRSPSPVYSSAVHARKAHEHIPQSSQQGVNPPGRNFRMSLPPSRRAFSVPSCFVDDVQASLLEPEVQFSGDSWSSSLRSLSPPNQRRSSYHPDHQIFNTFPSLAYDRPHHNESVSVHYSPYSVQPGSPKRLSRQSNTSRHLHDNMSTSVSQNSFRRSVNGRYSMEPTGSQAYDQSEITEWGHPTTKYSPYNMSEPVSLPRTFRYPNTPREAQDILASTAPHINGPHSSSNAYYRDPPTPSCVRAPMNHQFDDDLFSSQSSRSHAQHMGRGSNYSKGYNTGSMILNSEGSLLERFPMHLDGTKKEGHGPSDPRKPRRTFTSVSNTAPSQTGQRFSHSVPRNVQPAAPYSPIKNAVLQPNNNQPTYLHSSGAAPVEVVRQSLLREEMSPARGGRQHQKQPAVRTRHPRPSLPNMSSHNGAPDLHQSRSIESTSSNSGSNSSHRSRQRERAAAPARTRVPVVGARDTGATCRHIDSTMLSTMLSTMQGSPRHTGMKKKQTLPPSSMQGSRHGRAGSIPPPTSTGRETPSQAPGIVATRAVQYSKMNAPQSSNTPKEGQVTPRDASGRFLSPVSGQPQTPTSPWKTTSRYLTRDDVERALRDSGRAGGVFQSKSQSHPQGSVPHDTASQRISTPAHNQPAYNIPSSPLHARHAPGHLSKPVLYHDTPPQSQRILAKKEEIDAPGLTVQVSQGSHGYLMDPSSMYRCLAALDNAEARSQRNSTTENGIHEDTEPQPAPAARVPMSNPQNANRSDFANSTGNSRPKQSSNQVRGRTANSSLGGESLEEGHQSRRSRAASHGHSSKMGSHRSCSSARNPWAEMILEVSSLSMPAASDWSRTGRAGDRAQAIISYQPELSRTSKHKFGGKLAKLWMKCKAVGSSTRTANN